MLHGLETLSYTVKRERLDLFSPGEKECKEVTRGRYIKLDRPGERLQVLES